MIGKQDFVEKYYWRSLKKVFADADLYVRRNFGMKTDTGYPHDGRADNTPYRHDRRADKRRYPHDREIDIQMLKMSRNGYILS